MKHVVITLNEQDSIEVMQNYNGTELVHSDEDFAWFECTNLSNQDQDAICGYGTEQTVKLIAMMALNKPLESKEKKENEV